MSNRTREYGFWPQVVRPVLSWLLACLASGFLVGGSFASNAFNSEWLHLHELDWVTLLTGQESFFLEWWMATTAIIIVVSAIPTLLLVYTIRVLRLPRGLTDIGVMAFLPFFLVILPLRSVIDDPLGQFPVLVDIIPVGVIAGLLYWLSVGTTSRLEN